MENDYTLKWFDEIISVSLNPKKANVDVITDRQSLELMQKAEEEKSRLQSLIRNQVFSLTKESRIEILLKHYHSSLIILLDQVYPLLQSPNSKSPALKKLYISLVSCLDELLSFIEVRYSEYLPLTERVGITYFHVSKDELQQRISRLEKSLDNLITDKALNLIVLNTLYAFTNKPTIENTVTFKELLYYKELVRELELLEEYHSGSCMCRELNELLVYFNFNCRSFLNHYKHKVAEKIHILDDGIEKFELLLVCFKEFNQIPIKPGAILNQKDGDLKTVIDNWFTQEISYLEKKLLSLYTPKTLPSKADKFSKILSELTVDQMAIILRAADDLKIIKAKSLNEVFKQIVPHLSTVHKENISWDSMRSKSYAAESRDIAVAIQTLEKMIKRIREYD